MNPILSLLRKPSQSPASNELSKMVADVKAGRVDPMAKAKELVGGLSQAQKSRIRTALPMLQALAKRNGETAENINAFLQEVKGML